MSLFSILPVDLLRFIFQYLTIKELTYFDNLILNSFDRFIFLNCLNNLELKDINEKKSKDILEVEWIQKKKLKVSYINLVWDWNVSRFLNFILYIQNSILSLSILWSEQLEDKHLIELNKCYLLTKINLEGDNLITDQGIIYLLHNKRNITQLNLSYCDLITSKSIELISSTCYHLKVFIIEHASFITDNEVKLLIERCPFLEVLNLSMTNISDFTIYSILTNCSNIYSLTIRDCPLISIEAKIYLYKTLTYKNIYSDNEEFQFTAVSDISNTLSDGNFFHQYTFYFLFF